SGERTHTATGAGPAIGAWLLSDAVKDGARLPGRMERARFDHVAAEGMQSRPVPVLLDGAHVPFNIEAVMRDVVHSQQFIGPCVAVVALGSDKDAAGFMTVLSHYAAAIICTESPGLAKGQTAETLLALATASGARSEAFSDAQVALEHAAELALQMNGWVLVTGSLYLVGALRRNVSLI
ncbi:MAG: bifunctional folylpolyglutamate synthase/dihydrofolate synthase, partial [Rhizobiaceae bacterium]|nr:bifunctional folylpolyglutamate synthase/dihydrofolate synthase [Rhizobiaceae bacterium]